MEKGTIAKVSYNGYVGEKLFDTTDEELSKKEGIYNPNITYGPVTIIVGQGMLVPGLDEALLDMEVGEERELELPPEKAFGKRDPSKIKIVPIKEFKMRRINPVVGMPITIDNQVGKIVSINSGRVLVDFNHELAGRTVKYTLKVEDIVEEPEDIVKELIKLYIPRLNIEDITLNISDKEINIYLPERVAMTMEGSPILKKVVANEIMNRLENIEKVSYIEEFINENKKSQEKSND
ncbi:MAG TPA: peptidylprolyl isomerase [Methanothermococcus okinawensis]|uniref:peptidylprolyl isomerase n=1 Tax=Methanothermococcus okinawensis TaxID=155863 RepID=A0A832YTD1_9EURY|nr:peptidylprolyl isomerase [Methanothermococcus okinawensis]